MMLRAAWGRRVSTFLALASIVVGSASSGTVFADERPPERFKGLTLVSALARLQQGGLRIVFSSELVRPDMIVWEEPRGRWPQEILEELLAPHGLQSKRGPSGTLLIVKAPSTGTVTGIVRLAGSHEAVGGVRIAVLGTQVETLSGTDGSFDTGPLPEGSHVFEVKRAGYLPRRLEDVPVSAGAVTEVIVEVNPDHATFEKIVVRPGDPSSRSQPEVRESLGRNDIQNSPELGNDPLLPVARLPGVASTDGSGGLNVRGGTSREVKTILDGLELYEPYHLKERGGPFSIIDSRNIAGIGLLGGAFPAEYGGNMSAVVEMDTVPPSDDPGTEIAVSSSDARVGSQGVLGERIGWLVSARRGDPSQFLDAVGADPSYNPRYWDAFAKATWQVDPRTTLSLDFLAGDDTMEGASDTDLVATVEEPGTFKSQHLNRYVWLTLERVLSPRLFSRTVLSSGDLNDDRDGSSPRVAEVQDSRATEILGLKQDWLWQTRGQLIKWGFEAKQLRTAYDYTSIPAATPSSPLGSSTADIVPVTIATSPSGSDVGVYVADRLRVSPKLSLELGLRWDLETYTPDRDGSLSPRVNAIYGFGDRSTLRLGWGYFYQPQKIYELQVQDGVEEFHPAERAEHRVLAFEHRFEGGPLLQLDLYQKRMSDLSPRFENLFDPFGFFPEADGDRVMIAPDAARADGLELVVRGSLTERATWWSGYSLSRAEDRVDGTWIPRSWDQRHALGGGIEWKPAEGWDLTLAGTYHSGRPTTPVTATLNQLPDGTSEIVPSVGERNSERLPAYLRFDVRVGRSFSIRKTVLRSSLTVSNVLDRENTCCIADFQYTALPDGTVEVQPQLRPGLPRLITLGIDWTF